jgi:two-component system chemotaxis sensor kinase CheA
VNDLLAQFLIECRELVDTTTADLLALERSPADRTHIDGAFRGFHTLKGAAGIVDFPAMGRALHVAEDVLAAVRNGDRAISADLVGDLLTGLDQVGRWLEEIEAAGDIPPEPDAAADSLIARFTRDAAAPAAVARTVSPEAPEPKRGEPKGREPEGREWIAELLAQYPDQAGAARAALRYIPDADCFYRGVDPLALMAEVPGLLAMRLTPREPWPALEEFNPFECNLVIEALVAATPEDVVAAFRPVLAQAEILAQTEIRPVEARAGMVSSPEARAVLEEQLLLVANRAAEGFAGRLASAGLVVANVLRRLGWADTSDAVATAIARGQREGNGEAFIAAVRSLLEPPPAPPKPPVPDTTTPETAPSATAPLATSPSATSPQETGIAGPVPRTQTARALRVDVERIDALVNLAGELLVAKNAVGHTARLAARLARDRADPDVLARALKDQHALLDRLVSQLQRSVLAIRVLPLRHVFQQFPRLIREMARDLGKSVTIDIEGETTEADKAIVEVLFEPLLHVVRNALDHGVEPEAERRAAGKPASATLRLLAAREGDQVIVTVNDDGRGIDPDRIRRIAASRGIATEATLREMTDQDVVGLIFTPGFSTADTVTGLSGRGVGMDAVRSAIARLGGQVGVTSQPGAGTSVRFTLPFSVMMLRVMTVEAGGQVFGIPIEAVVETAVIRRDRIFHLGAAEAIVVRDRTLPLVRLAETLGLNSGGLNTGVMPTDARIVVATADGQAGGLEVGALEVEAFGERMDVMLKPMEGLLSGVEGFAGTSLLGDGRVLIILNPRELFQ